MNYSVEKGFELTQKMLELWTGFLILSLSSYVILANVSFFELFFFCMEKQNNINSENLA